MAAVFWISAGLIVYTYIAYPFLIWLLTLWRRIPIYEGREPQPALTMVVAAYNEADVIVDKLDNTLALDYPPEKLQLIIASDCSDDATDDLVIGHRNCGITLVRLAYRSGKTAAQNEAVRHATGEVLVFSDANSMYEPGALQALVQPFSDARVGCVCGELRYLNPQQQGAGKGEGFYWRYEQFLKRRESLLGQLVGANGAIYAVRRELFEELEPDAISDLIMPLRVVRKGYRVVYHADAVAREHTPKQFGAEFRRRARIVARSAYGLWQQFGALVSFSHPVFAWQIWSHKVLRWVVPLFLISGLVTSGLLNTQPYRGLFVAQVAFYGVAFIGFLAPGGLGRLGFFYIPAYFCAINAGALVGLWGFITRNRYRVWEPVDRFQ